MASLAPTTCPGFHRATGRSAQIARAQRQSQYAHYMASSSFHARVLWTAAAGIDDFLKLIFHAHENFRVPLGDIFLFLHVFF